MSLSIPSWLQYISTSNTISNTYIQGFLDISQNLIVRNYPVTIVNGNVVLNGNIYCGNLINTNSISINGITAQNVMVNSDVSLNGNITVNNNIYSYNTNNKIVLTVSRDTSLNLQLINTALSSNKTLSSTQILNKINIFSNLGYTATIGIGNITTQPTILRVGRSQGTLPHLHEISALSPVGLLSCDILRMYPGL